MGVDNHRVCHYSGAHYQRLCIGPMLFSIDCLTWLQLKPGTDDCLMLFSIDCLTLVLLNPDIHYLCKQRRSRSVGFCRSQLIWICIVCHSVCESISTTLIEWSDRLKIRNGCDFLIYSAGQWLMWMGIDNLPLIAWCKWTLTILKSLLLREHLIKSYAQVQCCFLLTSLDDYN